MNFAFRSNQKLYLGELLCLWVDFIKNLCGLITITVLKNSLNYATAIRVSRQLVYLALERVNNEIEMLGWDALYHFLHNMISILIFHALNEG